MDLYLDNDVSLHLLPGLRGAGHQVVSARDLGLTAATDDVQLLTAAQRRWTVITSNRLDFTLLHDAWHTWPAAFHIALPPHAGILVLDHASLGEQLNALLGLLTRAVELPIGDELLWWHRSKGWQRRLIGHGWTELSPKS